MLGCVIVSYTMPWRSSFPCHVTCCGPDTLKGMSEGPPLMYPLDVTHVVLRRWRAGVRGRIRSSD